MGKPLKYALLGIAWFAACFLVAYLYLSINQPAPVAVDVEPTCSPKLVNPCAKITCTPKPDTRSLT